MFYTIFVFTLGVYVGQEYNIPSVKTSFTQTIDYISQYHKNQDTTDTSYRRFDIGQFQTFWSNFFDKQKED